MSEPIEDEFSEIVEAAIPRLDLVNKGANGRPFLLAKSEEQAGIIPADLVAELIKEAEPEPEPEPDQAKGIEIHVHSSVVDTAELMKAIHNAVQRSRARSAPLDAPKETPVSEPVVKDDGEAPVAVDDLVADAPGGGTADTIPGSPDWEDRDAETAETLIGLLGRAKTAVEWLSTREATEAATGDEDDIVNAWDLDSVACQIDDLIRCLAGFAASERLEADLPDELDGIEKAVAGLETPLAELERLAPVAKAGRVLSAVNEDRIRTASDALQQVLSSLPAATETDGDAQGVAKSTKEAAMTADTQAAPAADTTPTEPSAPAEPAVKAKGDPQMAVFDKDGNLVGTVDPTDLSPIAATEPPAGGDTEGSDAGAGAAPAPADPAATPAATVPGTDTVQSPPDNSADDQSAVTKTELAEALGEVLAPIVKQLEQHAELADVVSDLKERVEKFGQAPNDRKSPLLKGADGGLAPDPTNELEALTKAVAEEQNPARRTELQTKLAIAAIKSRFA